MADKCETCLHPTSPASQTAASEFKPPKGPLGMDRPVVMKGSPLHQRLENYVRHMNLLMLTTMYVAIRKLSARFDAGDFRQLPAIEILYAELMAQNQLAWRYLMLLRGMLFGLRTDKLVNGEACRNVLDYSPTIVEQLKHQLSELERELDIQEKMVSSIQSGGNKEAQEKQAEAAPNPIATAPIPIAAAILPSTSIPPTQLAPPGSAALVNFNSTMYGTGFSPNATKPGTAIYKRLRPAARQPPIRGPSLSHDVAGLGPSSSATTLTPAVYLRLPVTDNRSQPPDLREQRYSCLPTRPPSAPVGPKIASSFLNTDFYSPCWRCPGIRTGHIYWGSNLDGDASMTRRRDGYSYEAEQVRVFGGELGQNDDLCLPMLEQFLSLFRDVE